MEKYDEGCLSCFKYLENFVKREYLMTLILTQKSINLALWCPEPLWYQTPLQRVRCNTMIFSSQNDILAGIGKTIDEDFDLLDTVWDWNMQKNTSYIWRWRCRISILRIFMYLTRNNIYHDIALSCWQFYNFSFQFQFQVYTLIFSWN